MLKPPLPLDETQRLMSLRSLEMLDTPSEERFDRITRMARRMFGVDTCLISLVDSDRQWFKSRQGLDAEGTSRQVSFCSHAILSDGVFVVGDAAADPRFEDNPLVTGPPFIRFYAGCSVRAPQGHRVGTLCLIHGEPRGLEPGDRELLRDLAALVEEELKNGTQSTVDDLTQIANRRGFDVVASHMLSLCRRTETDAELLFFDLNNLGRLNKQQGREVGDEALREFASLLQQSFRTADVVARLGGDGFVVLLTAVGENSDVALERMDDIARENFATLRERLSWSSGRVRFDPLRHDSVERILADGDSSMYQDKFGERRSTG